MLVGKIVIYRQQQQKGRCWSDHHGAPWRRGSLPIPGPERHDRRLRLGLCVEKRPDRDRIPRAPAAIGLLHDEVARSGSLPDSPRSMWIEPQDAAKLLAPFVQLTPRLVSFLDPPTQSEDCAQLYERVDDGRQALMRIVATLSLGVPVLIDDGIVSYCIFGHELMGGENWWIIADPHVENTRRKMAHRIFLDRPWMMLLWDNFQD